MMKRAILGRWLSVLDDDLVSNDRLPGFVTGRVTDLKLVRLGSSCLVHVGTVPTQSVRRSDVRGSRDHEEYAGWSGVIGLAISAFFF
jgi:hypothetical protein